MMATPTCPFCAPGSTGDLCANHKLGMAIAEGNAIRPRYYCVGCGTEITAQIGASMSQGAKLGEAVVGLLFPKASEGAKQAGRIVGGLFGAGASASLCPSCREKNALFEAGLLLRNPFPLGSALNPDPIPRK